MHTNDEDRDPKSQGVHVESAEFSVTGEHVHKKMVTTNDDGSTTVDEADGNLADLK